MHGQKRWIVKEPVTKVVGKLVSALCPLHPSGNGHRASACSLSSRLTRGWTFLAPFAMPGTLLRCCHGEVIVFLLATGYLGEHQTAQPGPASNGPGAVTVPPPPRPPSPFTLSLPHLHHHLHKRQPSFLCTEAG